MKLLIVSHVTHYEHEGRYFAYSPYAREIDLWCDLFSEVTVAAPLRHEPAPSDACPLNRTNVRVAAQREIGGTTLRSKLSILLAIPALVASLRREMSKADAIHVRCPGNLGVLGVLMAPLYSRNLIAKYAGQWEAYPGEALTYRLQRLVLRSRWWRGPVTVYGKKANQANHVIDFFSSMLTADDISRAHVSASKPFGVPLTVVFTGRLTRAKNVHVLLDSLAVLKREGSRFRGLIAGDGPEAQPLRNQARKLGLEGDIQFTGALPPERIPEILQASDVFVLISKTEGWPKAVAEAMAFGLICIGSDHGLSRRFLAEGRGIVVPSGDGAALTEALRKIASDPRQYLHMREKASLWARKYSLDEMRTALRNLMADRWQVTSMARVKMAKTQEIQ